MSSRDDDGKLTVPKFSSFKPRQDAIRTPGETLGAEKDERKPSAPRFSSFKPKDVAPSRVDQPTSSRDRSRERRGSNHRRDKDEGRRHHREQQRDEEPPRKRRHHDRGEATVVSRPRPERDGLPGVFMIDVKGDPLIRRYGESDRTRGTYYRRYGAGRVLGTTGRLVIHHDGPRDQFSLRMPGEGPLLSRDHGGLRSRRFRPTTHPILLRRRGGALADNPDDGYLAIDENRNGQRSEDSDSSEDERPYQPIEDQEKPRTVSDNNDDDDDSDASPMDEVSMEQSNPLKWKSIQLNRVVKEHPENIDAWLELVRHQDALLKTGRGIDGITPENEALSYAEIKLSMLESALTHASTVENKQRVLTQLMKEGVKVWSTKTAAKKWAEVESEEKASFELWKTHLDFATSSIATFQQDNVKRMLLERLQLVLARATTTPSRQPYEEAIYVFLRTTCLLHDAGYVELAVAAWQSLLDLNFFRPSEVQSNEWALQTFGEFWECEAPRLGEPEARGWANYVETGGGEAPEPLGMPVRDDGSSRDAYKAWGMVERVRGQEARLPARTMDEGTDDDPFRVVIFSDIEPMLFLVPESHMSAVAEQLVDAFLLFSGYPPAFKSTRWTEMALRDPFIWRNGEISANKTSQNAPDDEAGQAEARSPPFAGYGLSLATPPDLRFASTSWPEVLRNDGVSRGLGLETIANVTRQLVLQAKLEGLGWYHLAVSFCLDPKALKKSAKMLLKQYPTNAELYNAYALTEAASGHGDVASKVLSSATELTMTSGEGGNSLLWSTWSLMALENGKVDEARQRVCAVVDESLRHVHDGLMVSAAQAYKSYRAVSTKVEDSLNQGDMSSAGVYMEAMILLAYLQGEETNEPRSARQGDISTAMVALHAVTQMFRAHGADGSVAHERVLQFGARLLYLHACKGPFRRVFMREQLTLFLDAFPENNIFVLLFEWADSSIRVIDETRQILAEKVLLPDYDNVASRYIAIKHELSRGNVHSTKTAFERAVSSDACKFNPRLWISYLRFCRAHEILQRQAKDVFYRALRHCPWSKVVMMEAFAPIAGLLSSEELKAVYNTMTAKGLRIHVDLDEFLEKRRAQRQREENRQR